MTKRKFLIILLLCLFLTIPAVGVNQGETVYVIQIQGEINPAVHQYLKSSLERVNADPKARAVIIEIDTLGGLIKSAEEISKTIANEDLHTISYVNTKAESAGVLITISADHIAMAPGGTIGSAEPIPNTEKTLSYWAGELRTMAQEKGRDEELVVAMADVSIEIPGVVERGRLLNLTTREASELNFLDVVATDYEEILEKLGVDYENIILLEVPNRVRLAQFLTSSYITPILLTLGFIGLLVELFTPGFGVGGTVGLVAFGLYFGGSILAGYAGGGIVIIFLIGIALLTIEAFAPGFGVAGLGGLLAIAASIVFAANSIVTAITSLVIAFILTIVAAILLLKYGPRLRFFDKVVLGAEEKAELGYTSNYSRYNEFVGEVGIVKTFLRPAGTIEVNGELLDVVSEGDYIESGTTVKIIKVEGRRIIVRKID
ncbi:NfeD family protein [Alkaliphilus transvaalensis]|uniref:NfeD family protein n=1 Tax=Alkaliphilus transvaalensis TaxID=114628 RepID=UPI00047D11A9|nr:NfeD family protein [Alkaliphilus transvaalensis]